MLRLIFGRSWTRWIILGPCIAIVLPFLGFAAQSPVTARALGSGNTVMQSLGMDTACVLTAAQMQTVWTDSPFYWTGVYIGGDNVSCKNNSNLNSSWLNTTHGQGWGFEFIWVGDQAPCIGSGFYLMSTNTSTANSQGWSNAQSATNTLDLNLGLANYAAGTPVIFDLESYGPPSPSSPCQQSVNAFMSGWTTFLHTSPAQKSGVYGSTCASNLSVLAGVSPVVDFIDGAQYDGNSNTTVMSCVSSGSWVNHQRIKQYSTAGAGTYYGVFFAWGIDYDCAYAPVAPSGTSWGTNC